MKMLVDNQLPMALAESLRARGHDCAHVIDVGLDEAKDVEIWRWAAEHSAVVVTKDEDFIYLANRPGDRGRVVWVRLGNCRNHVLISTFDQLHDGLVASLNGGQRIVEVR